MSFKSFIVVLSLAVLMAGCPPRHAAPVANEPIGLQLQRARPELKAQRFTVLLDFEAESDAVFAQQARGRATLDRARAHTGRQSLRSDGGGAMAIMLSSVIGPREFPAQWTLLGVQALASRPAVVTLTLQQGERTLAVNSAALQPNQWTPAMIDLAAMGEQNQLVGGEEPLMLTVSLDSAAAGPLWIDDLMLIDNTQVLVADSGEAVSAQWSIKRRGLQVIGEARGRFSFAMPTQSGDGKSWLLREANALRARFSSADEQRHVVIYADGRAFWDGRYEAIGRPAREFAELAAGHASPAELMVAGEVGRVVRRSEGDANNDGYNERRGAYQLLATGPRFEVQIRPQTTPLLWPVLEIAGLPEGKVLATVEGRLVERIVRLENGDVLMILPVRVERPTKVNVRVQ